MVHMTQQLQVGIHVCARATPRGHAARRLDGELKALAQGPSSTAARVGTRAARGRAPDAALEAHIGKLVSVSWLLLPHG